MYIVEVRNCVHLTSCVLELSSADTGRALISNYNKLVCSSRVAFSDESVQVIHSTAWYIDGRLSGYKKMIFF